MLLITFADHMMLDNRLDIVEVLFHLLKVIEVSFCKNLVSTLWYKFWPYKILVDFQHMGWNPGHGWGSRKEEYVHLKSMYSLIYKIWVEIYDSSIFRCYITQLLHLTHIQPKKNKVYFVDLVEFYIVSGIIPWDHLPM